MDESIIRYVHFVGILLFSSALFIQLFLVSDKVSAERMRLIARSDAMAGMSIIIVLISGVLLWFLVGKPSAYYSSNWVFYLKLSTLFVIVLLAIQPAVFFARNRRPAKDAVISIPKRIARQIRAEVALLMMMPLFAAFMARGYGVIL